ncbi:Acetyltransferase (isoleucine patch superfamily) [Algibacter lectus]|uniref:acyltransferase n=1 Tax=Algibacter lectus TaxID=221126 RepID=UPI0008EE9908|nr:hypothetical protein [Algibacter lectus]SFD30016.1 Acetyltransferase (isoleucine patch superfamily) [Algibacter lectus]
MRGILNKIWMRLYWFFKVGIRFKLSKTSIKAYENSSIAISKNVKIKNSQITVTKGSKLIIEEGSVIENTKLHLNGDFVIGKNNIISNGYELKQKLIFIDGNFKMGDYNRLRCDIFIRFKGDLTIGDYNNINEESEIRVDEKIKIGSFNQISYKVLIWDTNTHNIYKAEVRREITKNNKLPYFGFEHEKPKTKPVEIKNDCWIGREASIMKGTTINSKCIVGFRTIIINKVFEENNTIIGNNEIRVIKNDI